MFFQSMIIMLSSIPVLMLSVYMLNKWLFISIEFPLLIFKSFYLPVSVIIDWMSVSFVATVMFISSMIMMFSTEYIPKNEQKKFSFLMMMFILSMIILIFSDNVMFLLLGWDGLGLTSYALVIYYQNFSSSASGSITIFSNRVGDILIIFSIGILFNISNWNFLFDDSMPSLVMIFLTLAACSKSAQFPFSAWLPAAMAAPTPISALVHSSTLVTAGVYLMLRITTNMHPWTMMSLLVISSSTAIFASLSANWEQDMKKIIALSTLSQIAMMMFAISINATNMAFLHLIIHALFKSMMFLCAGILIHSFNYQDMRPMGTMFHSMPVMSSILGISIMSLMGLPFMSGFFSKDSMVEFLISSNIYSMMSLLMITSIGMTAAYSTRLILLTMKFQSKSKTDVNIHPYLFMDIPILIMALFSIVLGAGITWLVSPDQIILLPPSLKVSIILTLTFGVTLGMSLSYISKHYLNLNQPAISLWFLHYLFSNMLCPMLNYASKFMTNDKTWQEMYGPYMTQKIMNKPSMILENVLNTPMFFMMMLYVCMLSMVLLL